MHQSWGKYLLLAGALMLVAGVVVYFFGDKLHWVGRLPGDVRVARGNFQFYFPIATMLLLSLLLTVLINLLKRIR